MTVFTCSSMAISTPTASIASSMMSPSFQIHFSATRICESGIFANQFIEAETKSHRIKIQDFIEGSSRPKIIPNNLTVSVKDRLLHSETKDWFLQMDVASDCRTQNIDCNICELDSVQFRVTKPIDKGEKLVFWFASPVLAKLEMPFLKPVNIQGGDRYVCHRCPAVFPAPNPLKLHIYFNCSAWTLESLWKKVGSAFQKVPGIVSPFLPQLEHRPGFTLGVNPQESSLRISGSFSERPASSSPAEVETLVSSLGRSRHGHLCIYCGKIYSRKYGLKIHIRTHTGYKPLKCPICSRPFGDPSNLNKHIRLHADGNTPYRCDLCGKVLVRRRDLERHQKSRHPDSCSASGRLSGQRSPSFPADCDPQTSSNETDSTEEDITVDI